MSQVSTATIRHISFGDLPILLRAQSASTYELEEMDALEVAEALRSGGIEGLLLDAPDRFMLVCWQRAGTTAMLTALYREGSANNFVADLLALKTRTLDILGEWGVSEVFLALSLNNPEYGRLYRMYRRGGFKVDMLRMKVEV